MVPLTSMHDYWKNHSFNYTDLCQQCLCFLFLIHCLDCQRFSSKEQVAFNSVAVVTVYRDFGAQENKICHCFHFFPFCLPCSVGLDIMILVVWMLNFKSVFSLSSFILIKRLFSSSSLSATEVVYAYLRLLYFSQQSWFQLVIHPARHFSWCTLHRS